MPEYEKMYYELFNGLTDAIAELEKHNYDNAAEIMKAAQIAAEEIFMNTEA